MPQVNCVLRKDLKDLRNAFHTRVYKPALQYYMSHGYLEAETKAKASARAVRYVAAAFENPLD